MSDDVFCQQCGGPTHVAERDGAQRPVCLQCGQVTYFDPKLAVAVVVVRGEKVLLGRRAAGAREAGRWSFPAGFVERGEQVETAARREVKEEVGLTVELGDLVGVYSYQGEPVVLLVYLASGFAGEPVAGDDLDRVGWFGPDELPDLAFPHDREIIVATLAGTFQPGCTQV